MTIKTDCVDYSSSDDIFSLKLCQGIDFCCLINVLDNPKKNDYEYCEIDYFSGNLLGGCQNFALDLNKKLKINVEKKGPDDWKGLFIDIEVQSNNYHCPIKDWMNANNTKLELECSSK